MTDDLIKNIYDKYLKNWFKKNYKYLLVILLYFTYQFDILFLLINACGLNIMKLSRTYRIILLTLIDLLYVGLLIKMFYKEIKLGLKDLKKNFNKRASISILCWAAGSIIMSISSIIISYILKEDVSANEALVRESIKNAPIYMLFTCTVVAPIFEELLFRRSLAGLIKKKWLFIISSGVCFGLLHIIGNYKGPLDLLYIIPYGSMGCCFAYLYSKTKNITLPIFIHMTHNFLLVLMQIIRFGDLF